MSVCQSSRAHQRVHTILALLFGISVSAAVTVPAFAGIQYRVDFIESPIGLDTFALDINDVGQILGVYLLAPGSSSGFVLSEGDGFVSLPDFSPDSIAEPFAINLCGVVVGRATFRNDGHMRAIRWLPDGSAPQDLGDLGAFVFPGGFSTTFSEAAGVNDRGQVVGTSSSPEFSRVAFLWSERDGMVSLGTLGGDSSSAADINNHGVVVGASTTAEGSLHAFMWTRSHGMRDLGAPTANSFAEAARVNDHRQVSLTAGLDIAHAYRWSRAEGFEDLDAAAGASIFATGHGIDERGRIVGSFRINDGPLHAAIWDERNHRVNLGAGITMFSAAQNLNNAGTIVGFETDENGASARGIVWTPLRHDGREQKALEQKRRAHCGR